MKRKRVLTLAVVLIVVAGISFQLYRRTNRQRSVAATGAADSGLSSLSSTALVSKSEALKERPAVRVSQSATQARLRVNPYAVVRQGICVPANTPHQEVESRKKWEALLRDPFWQSIFSGVNPENFSLVKTSLPLHRYVTYWKMEKGQLIHWTGRKVLIPAGTRVFSDGRGHMYLCACGNQVATVVPPRMTTTVLPDPDEPPVAYLVPATPEAFPVIAQGPTGVVPLAPPQLASAPPPYDGWIAPIPPPILEAGGPSPPGSGPGPNPPPVPLPVVPEPGTFSLILIGLGAGGLARRRQKRG